MWIGYTVCHELGEGIILKKGDRLDGCGTIMEPRWDRLDCSDCVWIVPGTMED